MSPICWLYLNIQHPWIRTIRKVSVEICSRKTYDISVKDIFVMLLMPLLQARRAISNPLFMYVTRIRATIRQSLPRLSAKFPNERHDNSYRRPVRCIILYGLLQFPVTNRYSRGMCKFVLQAFIVAEKRRLRLIR